LQDKDKKYFVNSRFKYEVQLLLTDGQMAEDFYYKGFFTWQSNMLMTYKSLYQVEKYQIHALL